jgi:hypothetical protein
LAALVGINEKAKEKNIKVIFEKMKSGSILLLRSVDKNKIMLYNKIKIENLPAIPKLYIVPENDIINSIIFLQK